MADLKYILEALRQKPTEPGIYREFGRPVRRQAGGSNPLKSANTDINYHRYVSMQHEVGESPVSYEEWLQK